MKFVIINETLKKPYDEGMKNYVVSLIREFKKKSKVLAFTNQQFEDKELNLISVNMNKFFLNFSLFKKIKKFNPDSIIYIPYSSITFFAFLRAKFLSLFTNKKLIIISLQRRKYGFLEKIILPFLKPNLVITSSEETYHFLNNLGFNINLSAIGIDTDRFYAVSKNKKNLLRKKWNLLPNKKIFLHIGHLKKKRNIQSLFQVLENKNNLLIIVASTTYKKEMNLKTKANLIILDKYIPNIEELYQLSDYYLFLAQKFDSAIDVPLSVLEALSCNINVITTNFGGLNWMLKEKFHGLIKVNSDSNILTHITKINPKNKIESREKVKKYDSKIVFKSILEEIQK
ncbi:MAG: glycosyltransferase [archaeon]